MQKKTIIFFLIMFFTHAHFVFSSGLESKGIGARARGMGFAMVSLTDDWTAVHYNPAGVSMVEGAIFGSEYEFFTGSIDSTKSLRNLNPYEGNPWRGDFIDFIGDEPSSFNKKTIESDIHFGAFGFIFHHEKFSYGIGLYGSGSGTAWKDKVLTSTGDMIEAKVSFTNGSMNIPVAFSYKMSDELSLGINLGVHWGLLTVENSKVRSGHVPYISETVQDTDGLGLSTDLGVLWKSADEMNFGLVIKLPYTFTKEGKTETELSLMSIKNKTDMEVDMKYPLRIALGTSYKHSKKHLIAFNLTWLNWEEYRMIIDYKDEIPGIFTDSRSNPSDWQNTYVFNAGYEYTLNEKWRLRCGLTYDEAAEPEKARILTGGQVVDSWLFSIGAGVNLGDMVIDFGYIHTYGPKVDGFIPEAKYSMSLHEFFIGLIKKL